MLGDPGETSRVGRCKQPLGLRAARGGRLAPGDGGGARLPMDDCYRLPVAERAAKYALLSLSFGVLDPARFERAIGATLKEVFSEGSPRR